MLVQHVSTTLHISQYLEQRAFDSEYCIKWCYSVGCRICCFIHLLSLVLFYIAYTHLLCFSGRVYNIGKLDEAFQKFRFHWVISIFLINWWECEITIKPISCYAHLQAGSWEVIIIFVYT